MKKRNFNVILSEEFNSYNEMIPENDSISINGDTYSIRIVDGNCIYDNESDSFDYSK